MKKYSDYKNSGVEWVREIPTKWIFGVLKYKISNNDGGVWGLDFDENEEDGTIVIRSTEITIDGKWELSNPMKRKLTINEINKSRLYKGDIVITKSSGSPNHIGKSVIVDEYVENLNCCYSNFVQRIRFTQYNPQLYHYILNSHIVREQFRYLTQTTTGLGNLNSTTFNNVKIPYIPISEQYQIVEFLDSKTELIDNLISTKERKITLLKELRTSLINQVVTKGLNPNVKLKESGVEWIGKIPEHWKFHRFSYIISKSDLGGNYESSPENEGIPLMKMGNIGRGKINLNKVEYLEINGSYDSNHILKYGDFLFNTRNSIDLVGKVSIWRDELDSSLYNSNILRISFKNGINSEYMCYLFNSQSILDVLRLISKGTTSVSGIYYKDLSGIKICVPDINEQNKIVEYLDFKSKEIDDLVQLEQKKIDLLKEYRQSLISEVSTGKIKVTI